jgi:Copper transport outer membrane protein, MctB
MLDMRYHVISLVAVFLALGIGILLGTTIVERGLISEQKAQIRSLRKTFNEIKDKNKQLNDDLDAYTKYSSESRPYMITGRLAGKSIAVLAGKDFDEKGLNSIYDGVVAAGGVIPATIVISGSEAYKDQAVIANLNTLFGVQADEQALRERVYAEVVNQLKTAGNLGILTTLEQLGVIQMRGVVPGPVSQAALLGGIEEKALNKTDVPLVKAFTSAGFPLIGLGSSKTPDSVLVTYSKNGLSTVDHVDTTPGQVAMVMVLQGASGNYGSGKSSGGRMIPEPPAP